MNESIKTLILASASPFRQHLMREAGLQFSAIPAEIDERAVEQPIRESGATPEEVARQLAIAKAMDVSRRYPGAYVIGSDQVMSMAGRMFHKCLSREEARSQLGEMRGATHRLSSAIAIARDGKTLWTHVSVADMTFRKFSDTFLNRYMETAGDKVLLSVGAYQYEGLGQQLFEKVEGDYFTIIGLPMLPLLAALRDLDVIDD